MKLPHSLRIIIVLLRLTLGLDFFYLGWSSLFNASLGQQLRERSLTDLYSWLGTAMAAGNGSFPTLWAWAFLIIGAFLVLGLATRLAAIGGIAATLASYLPTMSYTAFNLLQFINDEVLVVICLLILIFSDAGGYLGVDMFFHWHFARKHKK